MSVFKLKKWPSRQLVTTCTLLISLLSSPLIFAADGRDDYDLDNDGLIEINDLADLDEIRNNLDGTTLYASNAGCPNAEDGTVNGGCIGFELTADLDFDTNQDAVMDTNDTYWSNGEGWSPIGSSNDRFTATFEGNGHVIRNLYINRPGARGLGLFGYIENAQIQNIGVTGELGRLAGDSPIGVIAAYATDSSMQNVFNTLSIYSTGQYKGGIVGALRGSTILNAFNTGSVITTGTSNSYDYAGGIAGHVDDSSINNTFSSGFVFGRLATGGSIGNNQNGYSSILNSYWAVDSSNQANSYYTSEKNSFFGLTLAKLQCATQANSTSSNSDCVSEDGLAEGLDNPVTLFKEWSQAMHNGQTLWDFGDVNQLPALVFNGLVYRDSDGDGSLDSDDAWPHERAASIDADNDGHPDIWTMGCNADCIANSGLTLDKFSSNDAAWQDDDFDGLPDTWAEGCDNACQSASNLILDTSLNDTDNDGLTNLNDNDDNNDGITDVDADSDGLIEIHSLAQLDAVRHQLDGRGLRLNAGAELDQSGCPVTLYQGQMVSRCIGYELTKDLDFDTNHDGVMDSNDAYWNEGSGWQPIGGGFKAIFDGNGFAIENLYIDRATSRQVGLFSYIEYAVLKNMVLTGPLMSIKGLENVGGLAGSSYLSQINKVINTGSIRGSKSYIGGLIGKTQLDQINSVMNTGSVQGDSYTGGLIGHLNSSQISNAINTGSVQSDNLTGGLVGVSSSGHIDNSINAGYVTNTASDGGLTDGWSSNVITNSYWATDSSTQLTSHSQLEANSYAGLTLVTLQCATQANTNFTNSNCVSADGSAEGLDGPVTLFNSWDQAMLDGEPLWDFGNAIQLPALVLNGKIYRDSDGDGVLDDDDAWPNERFAGLDADADGYPEKWAIDCDETCIENTGLNLDQFPSNNAAWQDDDFDGLPDSWAASCDTTCQEGSGLVLDTSLNDTDNDDLSNLIDTDDNGDGITDIDADSDGLIDINSLELLNAMRYQLDGTGLRITSDSELNQTGCPAILYQGKFAPRCIGYEITTDLDFDINQDGRMDSSDTYWDSGKGWQPVGGYSFQFSTVFEGNGHTIRNLYINRTNTASWGYYAGLFGYTKYATLQNVVLTGPLMSVAGNENVGGLVGLADSSQINNVMNTGPVQGNNNVGGLVGKADSGLISNAINTGAVQGRYFVGGLVGYPIRGSINNAISTGYTLGGSNAGGLVGAIIGNAQTIQTNSYWAMDSSGQRWGSGQTEASSYVGITLATLQCATGANTNATNSDCVSSDGIGEGLSSPVNLFNEWDQAMLDGQALWDFGSNTQLPALVLNGTIYRDSDGDGLLDEDDDLPFDTDNDGLNNPQDTFPFIPIGKFIDSDKDGAPDSCNADCINLGMIADNDDDNDGALDVNDAFPLIAIGELLDTDNDGAPDECDQNCIDSGMKADSDDDNDGVLDVDDPNLGADNGAPELLSVTGTTSFAVTSDNGFTYDLLVDDNFFMDFSATDARDTTFTYEASLNGSPLSADENDIMLIPAGRNEIQWVAMDTSGNRSEPVEQIINVYPQVRFDKSTSIIGEASFTIIKVRLTGDSPAYPVVVTFEINDISDADQDDLNGSFDITAQHQVIIEAGDAESLNREAFINIPIIEDNESENNERLILDLGSAKLQSESDDDIESLFTVNEDNQQHELTITYQNLAPTVQFKLEQNGLEVANIQQDGGMVTLTAVVQDGNGNDVHSFIWDIDSLGVNAPLGSSISFDPINLTGGTYDISVIATDNGIGQLSDDALLSLEIIATVQESRDGESTGSGGSGGGSINWWFMLVILGLISGLRAKRREALDD
jgi:hypothetical protein